MNRLLPIVTFFAGIAVALAAVWWMQSDDPQSPTRAEVEGMLVDPDRFDPALVAALERRPEVVVDAFRAYQARQEQAEETRQREALASFRDELERSPGDPVMGPEDAPVTLVEFFDYRCGYCRRVAPEVKVVAEEENVRVVFKEFPILGPESMTAARVSLATWDVAPEAYPDLHDALMSVPGQLTEDRIYTVVEEQGLDVERIRDAASDPTVEERIEANMRLAEAMGVRGTPAFVVGDEIIPGAVGRDRLREAIRAADPES